MIILDTNVVWEPMKLQGDPAVTTWLDRQVADTLYLTATSLSELLVGIEILPSGRREDGLGAIVNSSRGITYAFRDPNISRDAFVRSVRENTLRMIGEINAALKTTTAALP